MARLYANENFPLQVVEALRRLGQDVLTVREAGQDDQRIEDAAVLAFAVAAERALLTINRRNFVRLHRQRPEHRGVIACTENPGVEGQVQRIHKAVSQHPTLDGLLI